MLSERTKKTLVLILAWLSVVYCLSIASSFFSEPLTRFWHEVHLYYWGWVPGLLLPVGAIAGTLYWKPGSRATRVGIIMVSLPVLIFNVLFFWVVSVVTHFTP
jgi:Na+/proline symporter